MTVADAHTDNLGVPGHRLGKRPTDPTREVMKLGRFLNRNAPVFQTPPTIDYFTRVKSWLYGQNDKFGTCGPTGVANLALVVSTWLADAPVAFTDDEIFDLYRRSGNPNFDPKTGADDNGVDMTVMLSELCKNGIGFGDRNVKALAFGSLDGNDPAEVWAGSAVFGGTLWGADLKIAQENQTSAAPPVWDWSKYSSDWGGHCIMAGGRYTDSAGTANDRTYLISWATVIGATDAFIELQVPERYVVIFPWHVGSRQFLSTVDMNGVAQEYQRLTGRPFPVAAPAPAPAAPSAPVSPSPTPRPSPTPTPTPQTPPQPSAFHSELLSVLTEFSQKIEALVKKFTGGSNS